MIALSTIGSLIGTWGTAFFLLSWIGSQALVGWLGTVQVVLGLLWLWKGSTGGRTVRIASVMGAGLVAFLAMHPVQKLNPPVHQEDSPYQQVRVRDDQLFRYLVLDRTFHAVMWKADPLPLFLPYSQLMVASLAIVESPRRGLILGHGGGSLAKWLAHFWPDLEMDIVEFDPVVVRMAEDYFDYHPPVNHHVRVKDGRAFLNTADQKYDVIWIDAFARHMIPFHLTTREFFAAVRAHLNPNGVVTVNLASSGEETDNVRAAAVVQTMKTAFPSVETFAVKGPWKQGQTKAENLIFFAGEPIAARGYEYFEAKVMESAMNRVLPAESIALLGTHRRESWPDGFELTDDFAPYDVLIGQESSGE